MPEVGETLTAIINRKGGVWVYSTMSAKEDYKVARLSNKAAVVVKYKGNDWYQIDGNPTNGKKYVSGAITGSNNYMKVDTSDLKFQQATNNGDEGGTEDTTTYIDDSFAKMYSSNISDEQYLSNLSEGLTVNSVRGILGIPHQFLPLTDPRLDGSISDNSGLGRKYAEKIIQPMPLLLMTPGIPSFMASYSKSQKSTVLKHFSGLTMGVLDSLINEHSGKYYSLKYDYTGYFSYVNPMLRSAAYYLGIEDYQINNRSLGDYNWLYYPANRGDNEDIYGNEGLTKFLGTYAGAIPIYVDSISSVDDSFSNSTTESSLAGMINGVSDKGRELNFLLGNVSGTLGLNYDKIMEFSDSSIETVEQSVNSMLGKGNVVSNLLGNFQTLLSGGRMLFPEIWDSSSFSRSYNCKMKLVSPSGDKFSIYLNILVPLFMMLAFVLPRQSTNQAYFSPFLVRAYYKGLFNVDMGIITDLSISKGDEGQWTKDGLPTTLEISFSIKDLYNGMFMSGGYKVTDPTIMSNITELDYIANSCGININEPEIYRTLRMYYGLGLGKIKDKFENDIFHGIGQAVNNKLNMIFGSFK